jgi:hypothetical protein
MRILKPPPLPDNHLARWIADPAAFIAEVLRDPETGQPFVLYPAELTFLRKAFTLNSQGRLLYPDLIFSAPKKSGKTALGAMMCLYAVIVLGGSFAEAFILANDFEQSQGRVFTAICRIIEASPLLRGAATITNNRVLFPSTGASITAVASEYAGFAGANPVVSVFDEIWGYTSERGRRLFDEALPSPAQKICRLCVTTAGFSGESELLEQLYHRGLTGTEIAPQLYSIPGEQLMFWSHELQAPWQTPEWLEQTRRQLRTNQFLRLIENRFVTSESTFIDIDWWDACVDPNVYPVTYAPLVSAWVGVDASYAHDDSAIVACTLDDDHKVRVLWHKIFRPTPNQPLNFESTIEQELLALRSKFQVRQVSFDPWQMVALAQRLQRAGLPVEKFDQTTSNLTEASSNLYELIRGRRLAVYEDSYMRDCIRQAVALESARGWRITKEKQSHKIDVVVALAQAALATVKGWASEGGQWVARSLSTGEIIGQSGGRRRLDQTPYRPGIGSRFVEMTFRERLALAKRR